MSTLLRLLAVLGLVFVAACPAQVHDPDPLPDAGDEAFVRRIVPVMYGRGPRSIHEVDAMVQVIEQTDRDTLVRALASSPEYVERWAEFFLDAMFVNRTGERGNAACYGVRRMEDVGPELAAFVRDHDPRDGNFGESDGYEAAWSMADLYRSALWLDDISPIYRANLFAVMAKDIPLQGLDAAEIVRENLWGIFEATYLNRQVMCLGCHNAEYAVTDDEDPTLDRSWPLPGLAEKAVFGQSSGRDFDELITLFRKHNVLGGYNIFNQQYDRKPTGCFGDNAPGCQGCACEATVCEQDPSCCTDTWGPQCVELCQNAGLGCIPGLPEDFDGCSALYGYPGCGGEQCACEADVCAALPQCCELSWTEFCAERCRLWYPQECEIPGGYNYDLDPGPNAISPWGMHYKCGMFNPPEFVGQDPMNLDSWFLGEKDASVSIWDVERPMHSGFDKLRDGPDIAANGDMDGEEALAWLISANIVDIVWEEVFGHKLTIANHIPRNEHQQQQLERLTRVFSENGFSLTEVLVDIAHHPDFNPVLPDQMTDEQGSAYALPRLYDVWVKDHNEEEKRWNSVGDLVHRRSPRFLARGVTSALGFPDWPAFPAEPDAGAEGRLQEQLGFFLKDSVHGFPGNDFQGLTAWEYSFGACFATHERNDGCGPRAEAGCDGCACEYAVCVAEPECCQVRWDARCAGWCGDALEGCNSAEDAPEPEAMWIPDLMERLRDTDATVGDAVIALKDRLLADPVIDGEEQELLEDLMGVGFDQRLSSAGDAEQALRWACSGFLASPQFQFDNLPLPDRLGNTPPVTGRGQSFEYFCQELSGYLPGGASCDGRAITVSR